MIAERSDRTWHVLGQPVTTLLIGCWLVGLSLIAGAPPVRAQELPADDPSITREDWKERVAKAKQRIDQMRRDRQSFVPPEPSQEEIADRRMQDALDDPSLMPGDVVATRKGLLQFRGSPDRARTPEDFVPVER